MSILGGRASFHLHLFPFLFFLGTRAQMNQTTVRGRAETERVAISTPTLFSYSFSFFEPGRK